MHLKKYRILLIVLFLAIAVVSIGGLFRLRVEFNFDSFLPENDPGIAYYSDFKTRFEAGSNPVLVGIPRKAGVFDSDFLREVRSFTRCARRLPMAVNAFSLLTLKDYVYDPLTPVYVPVLKPGLPGGRMEDSLRIMSDDRFKGSLISYDGKMLAVVVSTANDRTQEEEDWFNKALWDLLGEYNFEDAHVVGYPVFHHTMVKYQQSEFGLYTVVASLVMLICMIVLFRRFWGTLLAFVSVFLGMIIFFGTMGWLGHPIDLMGTLYPILMVIVGTSDVVHLMTKYVDELRAGASREEALKITMREIGMATFLTSLTTAIGFLSLSTSNMPPIRNFGLYAAIGVFLAFGTVVLLTTALISWFGPDKLMAPPSARSPLKQYLTRTNAFTRKYPRNIFWGTILFSGLCLFGASQAQFSLTVQRDFPRNTKVLDDFRAIDASFKGVNALDIAVEVNRDSGLLNLENQRLLAEAEAYFNEQEDVGPVSTPLMFFRMANQAWNGANPEFYTLAPDQATFDVQLKVLRRFAGNSLKGMLSEDARSAWMFIKAPDIGSGELANIQHRFDQFWAEKKEVEGFRFTHTGPRHIFDTHQELLVWSLLKSIGLAFLLVSLFMGLVFKNVKVVIISLIPNLVPLLATAGLIGLFGFQLDPKVAIVFTVAFGIAVDDSIHFLSRFKLERDKGMSIDEAIKATFQESGKAIVITTLILFFGFASCMGSAFPPTYTIGLLLSLTLLVAMVADFLLLPVCLRWMLKEK